ncbi:unnamed protein product [Porites lobata]|uniref:Fibropellin-1 n=1 Tax=Porites lobata TaxID=104759 RepID=A0ABN8PHD9_9CNID|nr:unnamed protein product [Porites lobata]
MDCDECEYNNGGCEHRCIDYDGRYTCACNSGYKASQSNWKECVRITCPTSSWPAPSNGELSNLCRAQSRVESGTTCFATCNHGYQLNGPSSSRCGDDGNWSPRLSPNCEVRKCSPQPLPDNGDITPQICKTQPLHGQTCYYECSPGYTRTGPSSSTCDNGRWTQIGFYCRDTERPSFKETCPTERNVVADEGKTTATVTWAPVTATDNDHATVTVQPDVTSPHNFSEGSHTVIYTARDPSGNTEICQFRVNVQVLRCPVHLPPANGRLRSGACNNVYGSICHVQCNKGFKLKGSVVRSCNKTSGANQVYWTGNATQCEVNKCPSLDTPDDAEKSGYGCSAPTASYGTTCFFRCNLGYESVNGSAQRTCQENQQWSGTPLQCQAVTCPAITFTPEGLIFDTPDCSNSSAVLSYATECRFRCKSGYQHQGPGLKICGRKKTWTPPGNPFCTDYSRPTFQNCPTNIYKTADRGTTSATATWTPPTATDNSGVIPNMTLTGKGPWERFSAGMHNIRYIAIDGAGNIGECTFKVFVTVVRCLPRLYGPAGGSKVCTMDNMYGSECSFECQPGYIMLGSAKRTCEKNLTSSFGFWTGNDTMCELVRCPLLPPPPHSVLSGCGFGSIYNVFGDKCLYDCDIGYLKINGSSERVCQANGTWSGQPPDCQVVSCRSLEPPKNGSVTPNSCTASPEYGKTCYFSCARGYRLHGEPFAFCHSNGQWSISTSAFCEDVERPSFGSTCPYDIKRYADKGKNYTAVSWPSVLATDNSGVTPNVSSTGVARIYYTGRHTVIYIASDEAGNSRICKFDVIIEVLRCQTMFPPRNGFLVGKCENYFGSTCTFGCDDGYNLLGAENISCEASPGHITGYWDNPVPVCKVRRCSSLTVPQFGYIYPYMCSSYPISGTVCYLECRHGFQSNGGVTVLQCGNNGKWNQNVSSTLQCKDVVPPVFMSCPSDIRASINDNSSASVNWTFPVATDNSNEAPQITVSPAGVTSPYTFYTSTVITYTATDASRNKDECSFEVSLQDNSGPEVVYCPPDQNITATQMRTVVTWISPQFKDNSNSPLFITCSHKSGAQFYWGTWNVHCTAFDNNPNNNPAVCQFTIRLKPKDCIDLAPPKNGAKACDDWAFGRYCTPSCNSNWDFTQEVPPFTIWVCGSSGTWSPSSRLPDCSKVYQAGQTRMAMDLYYFDGDCSTPEAQAQIRENFIRILNGSLFRVMCQDPVFKDRCTAENVEVTCGEVTTARRKRRSSDGVGDRIRTKVHLDIVVILGNSTGVDDEKQSKIEAGLAGVEIAKNLSSEIRKAVEIGVLNLTINGTVFVPDEQSLNFSEPEILCAKGQSFRDGVCVSCSSGTYFNKTLGTCEDCPVGSYQEEESQETCVPCPPRTSTEETRSDDRSNCTALCKAGSYSPTGLEPCIQCEKGFYQETEGQRLCIKCGVNTTTPEEGSNSSMQCAVPCPPGSFSPTGLAPCTLCNRRSFQSHNESRICVPCPGTTATVLPGSKSSQDCIEINECDSNPCQGNSNCTDLIADFLCSCQAGYTGKQCETNIDDCENQPCFNNGTCHDLVNNYTCTCRQGYQGSNCEDDVDECMTPPCSNNASCSNYPGGYSCKCRPGFTGKLCETDVDECELSPCLNGATCRDGINNYTCLCATGYQGNDCEENIDDCASDPCHNEGKCVDAVGTYHCVCLAGFNGTSCQHNIDECVNVDCKNNATCTDQINGFYCACQNGFTGNKCEVNIDECASNPCRNQARCADMIDTYRCECKDGFVGLRCENNIDECASNPCSNNGTCHDGINNFTCACPPGFTGNTCSLDIDYCSSTPCLNNASCFDGRTSFTCQCPDGFNGDQCQYNIDECENATCFNGGTCIDGIYQYTCACQAGFTGFNCELNIDDCAHNPCLNDGTCRDLINDFKCACRRGYTGKNCSVDINECFSSPCQNNGTCNDKVDGYTCSCVDGFSGIHCERNIDDCLGHSCTNGSICRDGINSYTCDCRPGFWGRFCESEVDECESFPCNNGGTCNDQVNAFNCACQTGFAGNQCEINIDDCKSTPCLNNATCVDLIANYTCSCRSGFTGLHCESRIDYCGDANCTQNGVCVNLFTGFNCKCSGGYFGEYCEFEIDECSAKPCFNNATCDDAIDNFTCSCSAGFTGRYCEQNIDDCVNNSCQNNATCVDHTLGYSCLCAEDYNGTFCETEINKCDTSPCQNNGTCIVERPGYICRCPDQFAGVNCENLTDPCLSLPCQNGATCHADNATGSVSCLCKTGFTGSTCDVNIDDCASEPCMANSFCLDLVNGYECKCYPSHTGDHCDIFLGSNFDLIFKRHSTSDMVLLSDGKIIPTMRFFTIALFVRADSEYSSGILFSYSVPGVPQDVIILSFTESQVKLTIKTEVVAADFKLPDNRWNYVGVVWDGTTGDVSVYINGPEKKKRPGTFSKVTLSLEGDGWFLGRSSSLKHKHLRYRLLLLVHYIKSAFGTCLLLLMTCGMQHTTVLGLSLEVCEPGPVFFKESKAKWKSDSSRNVKPWPCAPQTVLTS